MAEAQDWCSEPHPRLHQGGSQSPASPPDRRAGPHWRPCSAPPVPLPLALPWGFVRLGGGWGGGATKAAPLDFWPPMGGQPTACTLALWWLKFGLTEGDMEAGGGGK